MKNFTCKGIKTRNCHSVVQKDYIKLFWLLIFLLITNYVFTQTQPAVDLDQVRNGEVSSPNIPGEWVNGNLGPEQAHLAEGFSVPYRAKMSNLTPGMTVTIVLEYDVKHTEKHALDFLTNYDFMEPHEAAFGHVNLEALNPTLGTVFEEPYPATPDDEFEIPNYPDDSYSIAVKDGVLQPKTIQNTIRLAGGANMSIWNGDIIDISYGPAPDLNDDKTAQQIKVRFIVGNEFAPDAKQPVLLAWGGHIASRADWDFDDGLIASAGGISGSPYHMRLISWGTNVDGTTGINNLGNQDRSLKASAVVPPPSCTPDGPQRLCVGTGSQLYTATTDNLPGVTYFYSWTILNDAEFPNSSGATFPEDEDLTLDSVNVNPGGAGEYTVQVQITSQFGSTECKVTTKVDKAAYAGVDGSDRFCEGDQTKN
ncbi:hypothetical protein, partial [Christiangramia sp.]|uniref:hypothetical protein n=1 Tax=Christiangramia sp. TaxID=1931228 RepID=UPI00263632BB